MAGMVLETSQFFSSTITVSTHPGWALRCPTASCQPKRRNHHANELAMPVLGTATTPRFTPAPPAADSPARTISEPRLLRTSPTAAAAGLEADLRGIRAASRSTAVRRDSPCPAPSFPQSQLPFAGAREGHRRRARFRAARILCQVAGNDAVRFQSGRLHRLSGALSQDLVAKLAFLAV